jgi:hypothetical protein
MYGGGTKWRAAERPAVSNWQLAIKGSRFTFNMKDLLQILLGFLAVAVFLWLYLRVKTFLYERGLVWRRRALKVEIQTLFHGNTKDQDQL